MLRRDGRFVHEGRLVTHARLHRALLRGVRYLDGEGVFAVQIGRFRGRLEVEDTPYWVVAYDPGTGEVELTDRTLEPLDAESLSVDPDEVLRCTVKGRHPARFTRAGQAHLLDALEFCGPAPRLRAGTRRLPVPRLAELF